MGLAKDIRLVITRPQGQGQVLALKLQQAGFQVRLNPLLDCEPLPFRWPEQTFDVSIFTSPTAVACAFADNPLPSFRSQQLGTLLAVGSKTQQQLTAACGRQVQAPNPMTSEGLLAMPLLQKPAGLEVLLVKGEGGRSLLPDTLNQRGARLNIINCYRRVPLAAESPSAASLEAHQIREEWWLVSSAEALEVLASSVPEAKVIVSSERLATEAVKQGLQLVAVAEGPTDTHWQDLLTRLVHH